MKSILSICLLATCLSVKAQNFKNKNLQSMVDAEKAFAQMAKDQNRKDAFLFYLTDDAITAGPNGLQKGKEHIKKQEIRPNLLSWEIAFTDIAASGDFGYNTGPWEFRRNKTDEKAIAFGEFNSIWKKQPDGQWKNVLDIGTSHEQQGPSVTMATSSTALKPGKTGPKKVMGSLLAEEKKFIEAGAKSLRQAYQTYLSPESRLCHANQLPVIDASAKEEFLTEGLPSVTYDLVGGEAASSDDLGYVYGNATIQVTADGKTETRNGVYTRFWKRENGQWRVVVDVLSY
jgi:ketosteroid isomerase-like protein